MCRVIKPGPRIQYFLVSKNFDQRAWVKGQAVQMNKLQSLAKMMETEVSEFGEVNPIKLNSTL